MWPIWDTVRPIHFRLIYIFSDYFSLKLSFSYLKYSHGSRAVPVWWSVPGRARLVCCTGRCPLRGFSVVFPALLWGSGACCWAPSSLDCVLHSLPCHVCELPRFNGSILSCCKDVSGSAHPAPSLDRVQASVVGSATVDNLLRSAFHTLAGIPVG